MNKDIETVKSDNLGIVDPLYEKQREDISRMRSSLLACSTDASMTKTALQNISVLRVYHQVARIIKYLDLMDKLEEKLYQSIEYTIDTADLSRNSTWITLLKIQEQLQTSMINSHKLLQPYLNVEEFQIVDLAPKDDVAQNREVLLSPESRESLRNKATQVLSELGED